MRFPTGLHPRAWHVGAWLLAAALVALALLLSHRSTVGDAAAAEPESTPPGTAEEPAQPGARFVSEIVDSIYQVGPAEFFALDLPPDPPGARAVHLLGTVSTKGRGKDIVVRLFRASEYDRWLRKRGTERAAPFWTSPRSRTIQLDHDVPVGERLVLLLDNGFSLRTPKQVSCQLQIQYMNVGAEGIGAGEGGPGSASRSGAPGDSTDEVPPPRSNEEEEVPPPPPPPPEGY